MMKWNEIIKALREDMEPKPTQAEVAKKCGITQRKLSFIENGVSEPNLEDLRALCKFYNVSANYILGLPQDLPHPKR